MLQYFNTDYYLQAHPDVARSGQHPLVHYSMYGFNEGRSVSGDVETRR